MEASRNITVAATVNRGCAELGFELMVCDVAGYDPTESEVNPANYLGHACSLDVFSGDRRHLT